MSTSTSQLRAVWALNERGARVTRTRIGVAWENEDGSIVARLDAIPIQGSLVVEAWAPPDDSQGVITLGGAS